MHGPKKFELNSPKKLTHQDKLSSATITIQSDANKTQEEISYQHQNLSSEVPEN